MADAALDTSNVHLGHWTNWSYGAARGSTVTLTRQDGALLTAFTALFVGYAGSRIWRIICFALHLVFSNEAPQDALYHQRQALLRNSLSGDTTVWDLCIVLWVWRKKARTKSIFIRILPLLVLGLITSLAFAAAGVFSAQISSSMGTEVLLSAKNCALVYQNLDATATDYATFMLPYLTERNKAAFERADQCFSANATSGSCSTYVRPYFPLTVTTNASCPFKDRVCRNTTANIMVDTGQLVLPNLSLSGR